MRFQYLRRIICRMFGHKDVFVFVYRFRRNKPFWVGAEKGRWVHGGYYKCSRCGKNLTKFQRL